MKLIRGRFEAHPERDQGHLTLGTLNKGDLKEAREAREKDAVAVGENTHSALFYPSPPTYICKLPIVCAARPTRNTSPSRFYVFSKAPRTMTRCNPTVVIRNRFRTAPARACGLWATHESALSVSMVVGKICIVLCVFSGRASWLNQSALCPSKVTSPANILVIQEACRRTEEALRNATPAQAASVKGHIKNILFRWTAPLELLSTLYDLIGASAWHVVDMHSVTLGKLLWRRVSCVPRPMSCQTTDSAKCVFSFWGWVCFWHAVYMRV